MADLSETASELESIARHLRLAGELELRQELQKAVTGAAQVPGDRLQLGRGVVEAGHQVLRPPNGVYLCTLLAAFQVTFVLTGPPIAPSISKSGSTVPKK